MNNDPRGTIIQQGNIMRIDNALIEEVFCLDVYKRQGALHQPHADLTALRYQADFSCTLPGLEQKTKGKHPVHEI